MKRNKLGKAGYVLSVIAFVGMWLGLFTEFSILVVGLYYVVLVLILVATLFLLLANEGFKNLMGGGQTLASISTVLFHISVYITSATMLLSVLSIVFLSMAKGCKHRIRGFVFSILSLIVATISFALYFMIKV